MADNQTNHPTESAAEPYALVIERIFDAPRELVWKAWTEPARLAQWWGPKGFDMQVARMDFRPGGVFHYSMRSPAGQELWGKFVYREIVAPERLVFINSFADEQGNVQRNPMSPTWPLEILNVLTLAEDAGRTTLTIRGGPHSATEIERQTFAGAQANVQSGFKGTLDQLADHLAKA